MRAIYRPAEYLQHTAHLQFFIAQLFPNAPPVCERLERPGSPHSVDPNGAEGFLPLLRPPQADLEANAQDEAGCARFQTPVHLGA